ncbi:MAG: hypothetical protein ABI683_15875 [Ginsengibacter sp.]
MKIIILTALLSTGMLFAFAQSGRNLSPNVTGTSHFSIGLETGFPIGENGKPYSSILGGSLQYEYLPASDLGITVNGGYLNYAFKSSYGGSSIGFVPLLAGVKYYFNRGVFFHAQLGAAIGTARGQGTSFAYAPGIGFAISQKFDAEIKYMGISNSGGTLSDVGARIAYNF